MPFKKILVALDGSSTSKIAADYAFWLASNLDATVAGQHVVDPRLVEMFVAPEFAEELGFSRSADTADKVFAALRKIGRVILQVFAEEAYAKGFTTKTFLDEGYTVEEILKYAEQFDLLVMGHHGQGQAKRPTEATLGSVAERIASGSSKSVLIAVEPINQIKRVLVAYDGSEPSRGALLMAENLAKRTNSKFNAVTVIPSQSAAKDATLLVEQGEACLRETWKEEVFAVKKGAIAKTLLENANRSHSLLVLGAYGYRDPEKNVLGTTTTKVIRETKGSVLVYRPGLLHSKFDADEMLQELTV
jgi:nucleotide-binding universal stress UspA family protein